MSDHDQQQVYAKGGDVTVDSPTQAREALVHDWEFVKGYAAGKGSQNELAKHIAGLGGWTSDAIALMPAIAKRTDGDIVLECAAILQMPLAEQVRLALTAKKRVSADGVREYLRTKSPGELANLDDHPDVIHDLRTKLLKGPLAVELPELATVPLEIYSKRSLVEWYVETMNPSLAAVQLAASGTDAQLVATLDALAAKTPKAWGWLDALHIEASASIGEALVKMRDKAKNPAARIKLTTLAQHYQTDDTKRDAERTAANAEFATQLGGKDDVAFLDAAARTQGYSTVDRSKVPARLIGASADTVAQYLSTLSLADVSEGIHLLHAAKGATREHVTMFLATTMSTDMAKAFANDTTRKELRQLVGRGVGLRELFSIRGATELHPAVVADEALRQWAYEGASPEDLLWVAGGSSAGAKTGCRLVHSEKGNGWTKQLPHNASTVELRRFMLNTTDSAAASWVKANLLHETKFAVDADENKVEATDGAVYGQGAAIRPAALGDHAEPALVLARIADLDAKERADLIAHPDQLNTLLHEVAGNELRAVELLAPTLGQLAKFHLTHKPELVNYVSTRPPAEQVAAGRSAVSMHDMLGPISPFIALPGLRQPDQLAKALEDNNELLKWIFEDTEASQALALLSRDPARTVVAGLMETADHVYAGLPAYEHLRKSGREGFDRIAKGIKDDETQQEVDSYKSGDAPIDDNLDKRAKDTKHAVSVGNLPANIADIIDKGGSNADLIAVVQAATPTQQIDLLSGQHESYVASLRSRLKIGPQHLFPELSAAQLFSLPSAASWLLGWQQAPTTSLHLVANNVAAVKALAGVLSSKPDLADTFSKDLPRGAALTPVERHALDDLAKQISNPETLRALFGVRFDVLVAPSYDAAETKHLWSVLQRLPPAQVDQNVVKGFTLQTLNGPVGQWSPAERTIDLEQDEKKLAGNDQHYNRGIAMTAAEVKQYYGLDDKGLQLAADTAKGWLEAKDGKYLVKEIDPKQFDATVLHEVGHSVDTLLGEHTELIYNLAGWRRYGYDQFEDWANEMGALDSVKPGERKQIVDAWKEGLRSRTAVDKLVGPDHPAITNTASPLAKFVDQDRPFLHNEHSLQPVHGKVFLQTPTHLASVKKQTWDAAPTDYSMTSPQEFFAECYVEYYCRFDGTQGTEALKGGKLPVWIKSWFDAHVDKIRLSPERVHKGFEQKS